MKVTVKQATPWSRAYEAALMTEGKRTTKEPTDEWKDKILLAEHSPIRMIEYDIYLEGIPSFVAMHLVRHHIGCEKFVVTNREDRKGVKPEEINRLTPVDMMMTCNAQALINISRKRLCNCASKETRDVWKAVKEAIAEIDPVMAKHMVRECEYRNMCPEIKGCGWYDMKSKNEHPTKKYYEAKWEPKDEWDKQLLKIGEVLLKLKMEGKIKRP